MEQKVLGEEHPDTAASYNSLAGLYASQKKYEFAISYFIRAYNIFINKLGFEHPNTKICRKNIKIVYAKWNPEDNFEQWLEEQMKETGINWGSSTKRIFLPLSFVGISENVVNEVSLIGSW